MTTASKHKLTDAEVRKAKPGVKPRKLPDGGDLYLLVNPNGSKLWRYKFRLNGKEGVFAIGKYPDISLAQARKAHEEARAVVAQGIAPITIKNKAKAERNRQEKRFSDYWRAWLAKQAFAESTKTDLVQRVEKNIIPFVDKKPVDEWTTRALHDVLKKVEARGSFETAKRMAGLLRRVFNEVLLLGDIENNPAANLAELITKPDKGKKRTSPTLSTLSSWRTSCANSITNHQETITPFTWP
ncbi:MAG: Arm DNA-binding domain-containing protein [Thiomicrospira sp.]|jgi:hypothetical protein